MISARMVLLLLSVFFSVLVPGVSRANTEAPPDSLKSSPSHRTVREKTVVVPPEVLRRWRAIKLAVIDKTRGTENIYVVPIGSLYKLPYSSLTVIVEAFLPSFIMEGMTITTSSNELVNPAANVRISDNGTPVFQGWLFVKFPNTRAVTHPKFGFSLIGAVPVNK
ncbi:MAG TPA: hypothetical protein VN642_09495 [Dongiaceae bacterium]|nr:hypothetical protein [Dongiaceae bacterium]